MLKNGTLWTLFVLSWVIFGYVLVEQPLKSTSKREPNTVSRPVLQRVAHAGSGWNKMTYTNSLQALDSGYSKGFRVFEIDLTLLKDQQVVCLHDLTPFKDHWPTLPEFLNWRKKLPFTPCTLGELKNWFEQHPEARLMTDIKNQELPVLKQVLQQFQGMKDRLWVQIYAMDQYQNLSAQGVHNIIWTLYRLPPHQRRADDIIKDIKGRQLMAITMPATDAERGLAEQLSQNGFRVLAHTINDCQQAQALSKKGVSEIYTDWLTPETCRLPS